MFVVREVRRRRRRRTKMKLDRNASDRKGRRVNGGRGAERREEVNYN